MTSRARLLLSAACTLAVAVGVAPSTASALWRNYTPVETYWCILDDPNCPGDGSHDPYAFSGTNNWTNQRIYRPVNHPVDLAYIGSNGVYHWSATGYSNPFYFTASYGYSRLTCDWQWWNDNVYRLSPVTCQGYGS